MNIREIYQLYKTLESGLPKKDEHYLIDEVLEIMSKISVEQFLESLRIVYGKEINLNPVDMATKFVAGLKSSEFFSFHQFINGIVNGRSSG